MNTLMQKCHSIIVTGKVQALPFDIDLPDDFSRASSDDEIDIGRKLDKGNFLLTNIKSDTSGIRTDTSILADLILRFRKTLPIYNHLIFIRSQYRRTI
jgi:hypothetical protein